MKYKKQVPEKDIPKFVHAALTKEVAILYRAIQAFRRYLKGLKEKI